MTGARDRREHLSPVGSEQRPDWHRLCQHHPTQKNTHPPSELVVYRKSERQKAMERQILTVIGARQPGFYLRTAQPVT